MKTQKSIVTEIWELKNKGLAENGNTILQIVNRGTGKIETFQKISERVDKRFTIDAELDENADSLDTEVYYGNGGYNRARYAEEVIARQTVDAEDTKVETSDSEYSDWMQNEIDEDTTRNNLERLQENEN